MPGRRDSPDTQFGMWTAPDIAGRRPARSPNVRNPAIAAGRSRARTSRFSNETVRATIRAGMRALAAAALLILVAACGSFSERSEAPQPGESLSSNLSVASAALAAGQPDVARRLYRSLAEQYKDAPEPLLGLGYIALRGGDPTDANGHFLEAAALAENMPATRAEALLGAGRARLAKGDTQAARKHLLDARELARDPSSEVWIENGLAVAAVLNGDFIKAEAHYARALSHPSPRPRITANFVRMLIASGRIDEAERVYGAHEPSYWRDGDGHALHSLIEQGRSQQPEQASAGRLDPRLLLRWHGADPLPEYWGDGMNLAVRFVLAGPMSLALRLSGEAGPATVAASARSVPVPATSADGAPSRLSASAAPASRPIPDPRLDEVALRDAMPTESWSVLLGRSRQWRLNSAAKAVAAASPEIADVQLLAPDVLYVIGKQVGGTSVSVLGDNGVVEKRDVSVVPDVEPLRALLAAEPELVGVSVHALARGVALAGEVDSTAAADRALGLAAASFPEGMPVQNNLRVGHDLAPLRALMVEESGLHGVRVQRVARGVALTGEVASAEAAERAYRLAVASLPEDMLVENNLRVEFDVEPLRTLLAADPDLRGVKVQALAHGVVLGGEVASPAAADLALRFAAASLPEATLVENNVRIAGPQQVNLEVHIAEVQRSVAEDFGFNWEVFGHSNDPLGFGFRIGRPLPDGYTLAGPERIFGPNPTLPPNAGEDDDGNVEGSIPETVIGGQLSPTLILQRAWDNVGVTSMIDALARAGLANVLARPNITAVSGETASFFSGGEYPLPTGFEDGVIIFEYKKYGVLLDFVPTVVDESRIQLTVRPEVSEPSQNEAVQVITGVNVPVMNVRRAETTVEMGDGESIVIAGLFRSSWNEVESGVPFLKDLPLLGRAFGHTSTRSAELELIVTVTARLTQAARVPDFSSEPVTSGRAANYYY